MEILITICARGGSKGIPDKNIKLINGKPLIQYSLDKAFQFLENHSGDIAISTDSEKIVSVINKLNYFTDYIRPSELASDSAGKMPVINDVLLHYERIKNKKYDIVLDLDVTSPLRSLDDLEKGLSHLLNNPDALNLFSVSKARKNPYFNMVEENSDDYYSLSKNNETFLSRQSAPKVFELNASFYFYTRKFFSEGNKSAISERSLIYEMPHICLDIDDPLEFEIVNYLIVEDKLDFKL